MCPLSCCLSGWLSQCDVGSGQPWPPTASAAAYCEGVHSGRKEWFQAGDTSKETTNIIFCELVWMVKERGTQVKIGEMYGLLEDFGNQWAES